MIGSNINLIARSLINWITIWVYSQTEYCFWVNFFQIALMKETKNIWPTSLNIYKHDNSCVKTLSVQNVYIMWYISMLLFIYVFFQLWIYIVVCTFRVINHFRVVHHAKQQFMVAYSFFPSSLKTSSNYSVYGSRGSSYLGSIHLNFINKRDWTLLPVLSIGIWINQNS